MFIARCFVCESHCHILHNVFVDVVVSEVASDDGIFTQVVGRKNKKSRKGRATLTNDAVATTVISTGDVDGANVSNAAKAVCSRSGISQATTIGSETKCCVNCSCSNSMGIIASLRSELEHAKTELNLVKTKVKMLTTHVNLLSRTIGLSVQLASPEDPTLSASSTPASVSHEPSSAQPDAASNAVTEMTHSKTYAAAVGPAVAPAIKNVQRNVVSAVYTDLQKKQRRTNNIVISGLTRTDYQDDKAVAAGMIRNEFHKTVTVKHCRRLGKKMTG